MLGAIALFSIGLAGQDATPPPATDAPATPAPTTTDAPAPAKRKLLRIAVYDLSADGVDKRTAKLVTDSIVVELRKLEGVSVVGMAEVRAMLQYEAEKQILGCTEGKSCAAEIGEALGVDEIVVGELATVGEQSSISLRRIDQANAKPLESFTQRLTSNGGDELLAAVGPAMAKLYPSQPLRKGQTRGVAPEVALALNPPPLPTWATVTTGVAGGVLLAAGVVAGASAASEKTAFDSLQAQSKTQPVQATLLVSSADRAQVWAGTANALYVGAVVVGAAAGVMFPFTDWSGARDARVE